MSNEAVYQMNHQGAEAGKQILKEFEEICKNPRAAQEQFLLKLLQDNKDTEYGKKYHFSEINSIEDYRKNVPVITFENIDEDIDRMKTGEKNILTVYNFNHMNETSGTVGKKKSVPLTDEQSKVFMKYSNQIVLGVLGESLGESWMHGRSFCTSEGNHEKLESGITVGCASSIMADVCKGNVEPYSSMLKSMYTSPPEAMSPGQGMDTKYVHTRFALADGEVTGITSGFISNVVSLLDYIKSNYQLLISDIENGTIDKSIEMQDETRESLMKKIEPMPERAAKLKEIFKNGADFPFVPEVWPKMQYIVCAGGDGFAVYDDTLNRNYTAGKIHRLFNGVTASEGLWSVPIAIDDPTSVIAPDSAFIEFQPVEAGDDFSQIKTVDELEEGKIYELVITNLCGYYRYRMSDAVKVVGFYNKTPKVQFMYRVNKTINCVGEKTTEQALLVAVQETTAELGLPLIDYEVYADTSSLPPRYVFLIESNDDAPRRVSKEMLEDTVMKKLSDANIEFKECCEEHLLQKPECWFEQAQTQMLYMEKMIFKGASRSQIKPVHVISNEEQKKFFMILRNKW